MHPRDRLIDQQQPPHTRCCTFGRCSHKQAGRSADRQLPVRHRYRREPADRKCLPRSDRRSPRCRSHPQYHHRYRRRRGRLSGQLWPLRNGSRRSHHRSRKQVDNSVCSSSVFRDTRRWNHRRQGPDRTRWRDTDCQTAHRPGRIRNRTRFPRCHFVAARGERSRSSREREHRRSRRSSIPPVSLR